MRLNAKMSLQIVLSQPDSWNTHVKFSCTPAGGSRSQGMRTVSEQGRISFDLEVHYMYTFGAPAPSSAALANPKGADGCFAGARYRAGSQCLTSDGSSLYDFVTTLPPRFLHPRVQTIDLFGKTDVSSFRKTAAAPCNEIPRNGVSLVKVLGTTTLAAGLAAGLSTLGPLGLNAAVYFSDKAYQKAQLVIASIDLHKMTTYKDKFEGVTERCFDGDACLKCQRWYQAELKDTLWLDKLNRQMKCPCTALFVDNRMELGDGWELDKSCSPTLWSWDATISPEILEGGECDRYHEGAHGCIRSRTVIRFTKVQLINKLVYQQNLRRSSDSHFMCQVDGQFNGEPIESRQQCCYSKDGALIQTGRGAGTPDKSSGIEHKADDVEPFEWCCEECLDKNGYTFFFDNARGCCVFH